MTDLEKHDLLPTSEIQFVKEDNWIVAHHEASGVSSQGASLDEAHEMITEAVLLARGEIGTPIETWADEVAFLKEHGFTDDDTAEIKEAREDESQELPEFLK